MKLPEIEDLILVFTTIYKYPSNNSEIQNYLQNIKKQAVNNNDQELAKNIWSLENILSYYELYYEAYHNLLNYQFYEAWCIFERIENIYNGLYKHAGKFLKKYNIEFVYEKIKTYQSLYPYKIFISPEFIEKEKTCNICGKVIDIRNPCGHEIGEIYNGEYCYRSVTKLEFVGTAFVKNPVQKYSVPFTIDPKTNEQIDHYDYRAVKYIIDNLSSPFDDWKVKWTKIRHPHKFFKDYGRNHQCPCGSGIKYKKCCLKYREGVIRPHIEVFFPDLKNKNIEGEINYYY